MQNSKQSLAEHLDACGVKKISSDNIFFHPHIPLKKLTGAQSTYAAGVAPEDVLVLIDDTVFGSAKDGVVMTSERFFFKEKFEDAVSYAFEDIRELACEDNVIKVNGRRIGSLTLADKLPTQRLFREVAAFLGAPRTSTPSAASAGEIRTALRASFGDYKQSLSEGDSSGFDDDSGWIFTLFLERQIESVGAAFDREASFASPTEVLDRLGHAQLAVTLLAAYSASLVPARVIASLGQESFNGVAGLAPMYFEHCRETYELDRHLTDQVVPDQDGIMVMTVALLSNKLRDCKTEEDLLEKRTEMIEVYLRGLPFGLSASQIQKLITESQRATRDWLEALRRL